MHESSWTEVLEAVKARVAATKPLAPLSGLPLPAPANDTEIAAIERKLGAALPPLLRALLTELADGGFGPGYGVLGVGHGHRDDTQRTALDLLNDFVPGTWVRMPGALYPLCTWGCAIYSFAQCPSGRIYAWDPNPVGDDEDVPFVEQDYDLAGWLRAWLDGTLHQP